MKIPLFSKISLAGKVGLLFAAAVLLIVSAALFVPSVLMNRLAQEQDIAEASQFATMRLLEHHQPRIPTTAPATRAASQPGGIEQPDLPGPLGRAWVRLRPASVSRNWPISEFYVPPPSADTAGVPQFVYLALDNFKKYPKSTESYYYSRDKLPGPGGKESNQFVLEYVRALRITGQCAKCHDAASAARPFKSNELVGVIYVRMASTEPRVLWDLISLNMLLILGAGLAAVLLAIVVFYIILKSLVLSPVRKLRRLADHIGEGDLAVRSTINTGDEFERLAKAFNSMLERLQVSQQQLRQINESLNSKMDDLARANVALFESNRLKSEFLARVSHELRTPLNSIIGFAEVLRDQMAEAGPGAEDGPAHEETARKSARYADNILTSGRMLLELINDLLDLSKIEAGKMVVRNEKVVVRDLVEAVVSFMRPAADKKNLQLTVTVDAELPLIETDGGKLQQMLYNLFSNAVKFTPPRGAVTVAAAPAGGELVLAVSDTGPGIPQEDQGSIFDKFHQLDSPATREHGGTGLGLSITQELATMLGGRISLVSKLGEGSTFTIHLPLKPAAGQP